MKSMKTLVCLTAWLFAGLTVPSMLQARDVSPEVEEQLMERLTEMEMEEFLAGVDPSEIPLASGETLDDLLRQLEARERQGLLFYPVTPCALLDTSEEGPALEDGERRPLWLRSKKQTSSSGDDRTCGADLDETSARVALLTVQLLESPGYGSLWIGPGDEREGSRLHLAPTATNGWTVTSELCDSSSEDACPEGDLRVSVEGTTARVVIHLLGFYGPPLRSPPTRDRPSDEPTESGEVERKASTSPFWEVGTGSGDIHYSDGAVGIGTSNPLAKLHVQGTMRVDVGEGLLFHGGSNYWGTNQDVRRLQIRDGNDSNGDVDGGLVFETWTEKDNERFPLLALRRRGGMPQVGIGAAFPDNPLKIHGYRHRATGTLRSTGYTVWGTGTAFDSELRVGSEIIVDGQVRQVKEIVGPDRIEINAGFVPEVLDEPFWYTHRLMVVDGQGRMGLGDLTPDVKLDVDGNVQASGRIESEDISIADLAPDDATPSNSSLDFYSRAAGGELHRWAFHSASVGGGWGVVPNSLTLWEYDSRGCEAENPICEARMVFQPNTGFVGIGTDNPSARLDVAGDIELSGRLRHDSTLEIEASADLRLGAGGDICIGRCE